MSEELKPGDYVLATKYSDGDPGDQYAIGWFTGMLPKGSMEDAGEWRYMVADNDGNQFRGNGFRRCERITEAEGHWMVKRFPEFKPLEIEIPCE